MPNETIEIRALNSQEKYPVGVCVCPGIVALRTELCHLHST